MAGAEDTGGEKTFDPTPSRLEEARRKGDIAKSTDISAASAYLGLLMVCLGFGAALVETAGGALMAFLSDADLLSDMAFSGDARVIARLGTAVALAALPLVGLPFALVLASLLAQRVFVVVPDKLQPKLSRISPLSGIRNKFGLTGLMEFAKALVKLVAIAAVAGIYLSKQSEMLAGLSATEPAMVAGALGHVLVALLAVICAIAVSIGLLDLVWQHANHRRKLRMTLQDIKEETKRSEGDPHTKSQRQSRAREIATNRMLLDVPKADVVIVNPVHVAVALRWSREKGSAPVCVAKGKDEVARKIRDAAATAGVPIQRDPPTARAIHATVKIGRQIRPEHYRAVAAALRFAEEMRRKVQEQGY